MIDLLPVLGGIGGAVISGVLLYCLDHKRRLMKKYERVYH